MCDVSVSSTQASARMLRAEMTQRPLPRPLPALKSTWVGVRLRASVRTSSSLYTPGCQREEGGMRKARRVVALQRLTVLQLEVAYCVACVVLQFGLSGVALGWHGVDVGEGWRPAGEEGRMMKKSEDACQECGVRGLRVIVIVPGGHVTLHSAASDGERRSNPHPLKESVNPPQDDRHG